LEGARRHDPPPRADRPPADIVHALHDRYLLEVVEGLGLCPFARRCREQGRVHRVLWWHDGDEPSATAVAERLRALVTELPDAEIVLHTFVGPAGRFALPRAFDGFVADVRDAFGKAEPTFYMVGFHADADADLHVDKPDRLVPLLRRTPDPVIQCVSADVLEHVRSQAQRTAHGRMVAELTALGPAFAAIAARSVQPDSELSADIARMNYDSVGTGEGRQRLERCIAELVAARRIAYAPWL
jgi:hypothetical protein